MPTIKELKTTPLGEITGGFYLIIKHTKKSVQVDNNIKSKTGWTQQVVFFDKTGDMLADVFIDKYIPLIKGETIRCMKVEVRENYTRQGDKLLYISRYERQTQTADEYEAMQDGEGMVWRVARDREIRGKIKCLYISSKIRTGADYLHLLEFAENPKLDRLVELAMEG